MILSLLTFICYCSDESNQSKPLVLTVPFLVSLVITIIILIIIYQVWLHRAFLQATRVVVTADEKESASQTPDLMETLTISERLDIQTHQESFDCEYNYDESGLVHFRALPGAPTLPKEFTIVRSKKNKKGVIHPTQQTAQPIRSLTDQYPRYMEHYYSEFDKLAPQLLNGDQRQRPEDLGEEVELISYPLFSQPS